MKNKDFVYVLRVVDKDMKSSHGFKYPRRGRCTAPDWKPVPYCGNGLHGWLNGEGDIYVSQFNNINDSTHNWLVIKVNKDDLVNLVTKCKFRTGYVVFCGDRYNAIKYLEKKKAATEATNWRSISLGTGKHLIVRSSGNTITAKSLSVIHSDSETDIVARDSCNIKVGNRSKVSVIDDCQIVADYNCIIKAQYDSTITAKSNCQITVTGSRTNIVAGNNNTIRTDHYARIKATSWNKIETGYGSDIVVGSNSDVKTLGDSRIKIEMNCIVESERNTLVEISDYFGVILKLGSDSKVIVYNNVYFTDKDIPRDTWVKWSEVNQKWEEYESPRGCSLVFPRSETGYQSHF